MDKLFKIYCSNKNNDDIKIYVNAVLFGSNPFIQIMPAFSPENAAIYEEEKAQKYIDMLNEENKDTDIYFYMEEYNEN